MSTTTKKTDKETTAGGRAKVSNLRKDLRTVLFQLFFYMLRGFNMGINETLLLVLTKRGISLTDLSGIRIALLMFLVLQPVVAPIVDTFYIKRVGKRFTWLLPSLLAVACFQLAFAGTINGYFYSLADKQNLLIFIALTTLRRFVGMPVDLTFDAWAISSYSKENVSWQSTIKGVADTFGNLIGSIMFVYLESAEFSNSYVREWFSWPAQEYGLITFGTIYYIDGAMHFISLLVLLLLFRKSELAPKLSVEQKKQQPVVKRTGVLQSYKTMFGLFRLSTLQLLFTFFIVCFVGQSTTSVHDLRLIQRGMPIQIISIMNLPLKTLTIVWSILISKYTTRPRPFLITILCSPVLTVAGFCMALVIFVAPYLRDPDDLTFPFYFYLLYFSAMCVKALGLATFMRSYGAFVARIVDMRIGSTFLSLLTTMVMMGFLVPSTIMLYVVDKTTFKQCELTTLNSNNQTFVQVHSNNTCSSSIENRECEMLGGKCAITFDSLYGWIFGLGIINLLWVLCSRGKLVKLAGSKASEWTPLKPDAPIELVETPVGRKTRPSEPRIMRF